MVNNDKKTTIRLTDMISDIGTGDFSDTNYPGLYVFGYNPDEDSRT